jgi:hypothetical protein
MHSSVLRGFLAVGLGLCGNCLFADVMVTSASAGWVQVGGGADFELPFSSLIAQGCQSGNCAPPGAFQFNKPFANASGYFTINEYDPVNALYFVSDTIVVSNNSTGGLVGFFSGGPTPAMGDAFDNSLGVLCSENAPATPPQGCTGQFTLNTTSSDTITVTAGGNIGGRETDPFGGQPFTADRGVSFEGATPLPEPSLGLLMLGLAGILCIIRFRLSRRTATTTASR